MTDRYRFDRSELAVAERQLTIAGAPAAIGARAFDLLLALVERRDRVVAKSELLDLVWPGLVVEENNLQVQVSALRKLLGADAIATVAGRGYRFTARAARRSGRPGSRRREAGRRRPTCRSRAPASSAARRRSPTAPACSRRRAWSR